MFLEKVSTKFGECELHWRGHFGKFGPMFQIFRNGKLEHAGCRIFATHFWERMTGRKFPTV